MLIYARKNKVSKLGSGKYHSGIRTPVPPAAALDVVNRLNATHDEACERYAERYPVSLRHLQHLIVVLQEETSKIPF